MSKLILLLTVIGGVKMLKDVSVVVPEAVKFLDTVTLQCKYNLEGEPLYTVKWYKGQNEIYRYIPKELPNMQIFALPGINIDLSKSTANEMVLRNVQVESSGRYKCEVSTDSPNFYTKTVSSYMHVVDVPETNPVMAIEKQDLQFSHTIKGNCTSPPSFPPMNITWYLNGIKINESGSKRIQVISSKGTRRPQAITVSFLDIELDDNVFKDGFVRVQCVATLFNLYRSEDVRFVEDERTKPRPSSILGIPDVTSGSTEVTILYKVYGLLFALILHR